MDVCFKVTITLQLFPSPYHEICSDWENCGNNRGKVSHSLHYFFIYYYVWFYYYNFF
jgi:hypothetical protein